MKTCNHSSVNGRTYNPILEIEVVISALRKMELIPNCSSEFLPDKVVALYQQISVTYFFDFTDMSSKHLKVFSILNPCCTGEKEDVKK